MTKKTLISRIYHPHTKWEETRKNMWGTVDNRATYLAMAIAFTGDDKTYGSYMLRVLDEWKYSCEHNLSNRTQNRRAWIGHAACALAFECPEDVVREAWGKLTDEQRLEANKRADEAIEKWEIDNG